MEKRIKGLHHITAIAGNAQKNYDFYTKTLGVRLVKKTVNFDDPGTYHLYYGDTTGSPGSILTFFPWDRVRKGYAGVGMATEISYHVLQGSIPFWIERLEKSNVNQQKPEERFGETVLPFEDPDGLWLNLIENHQAPAATPWTIPAIGAGEAITGFHSVTLTLRNVEPTAKILTDIFGYRFLKQESNRYRYITDAVESANIVDIVEDPTGIQGINAGGTNHHVAFRVENDTILMEFREKILKSGLHITEKIDRNYFYSLYFREPGGVLFELATDNPGFATDEPQAELGTHLMLPPQYEKMRSQIINKLPELKQS